MRQSGTTAGKPKVRRRTYKILGLALILLTLALALPGTASAVVFAGSAKPSTPFAKAPKGTIITTTPTFSWSAVKSAQTYELRVLDRGGWVLKKTAIRGLSYTSQAPLPANSNLTWQVRAMTARGAGSWSEKLAFRIGM